MTHKNLQKLAAQVGEVLLARKQTLTLAESCTGGWIGQAVTAVPGSSGWFERGFVTYSNCAKTEMLGVSAESIRNDGAVSRVVVEQMAAGALAHSQAQWSVAVSGVAGPGGGSAQRPVGTVWIAWCGPDNTPQAQCFSFPGDREAVRHASVVAGLQGLLTRMA